MWSNILVKSIVLFLKTWNQRKAKRKASNPELKFRQHDQLIWRKNNIFNVKWKYWHMKQLIRIYEYEYECYKKKIGHTTSKIAEENSICSLGCRKGELKKKLWKWIKMNSLVCSRTVNWDLTVGWRGRIRRHFALKHKPSVTSMSFFTFFLLIMAKLKSLHSGHCSYLATV